MADETLLSAEQVAGLLGVSVVTIRGWAREQRVPCVRLSRRTIRYRLSEIVEAFRLGGDPKFARLLRGSLPVPTAGSTHKLLYPPLDMRENQKT